MNDMRANLRSIQDIPFAPWWFAAAKIINTCPSVISNKAKH